MTDVPDDRVMIQSPCVRNCCLDDNDVCLGCFRTLDEIVGWASSDNAEQKNILTRCETRRKERRS